MNALESEAEVLKVRFDEAFWCEDIATYALALDRDKKPCRVRTSNAGHCLFAGIARPDRARRIAETLLSPTLSPAGAFALWLQGRLATILFRTTMVRSGRTTTRSSPAGWRDTNASTSPVACCSACLMPVDGRILRAFRNYSVDWNASGAKARRFIRLRVRRKHGLRARYLCCCKLAWGFRAGRAEEVLFTVPIYPMEFRNSGSKICKSGTESWILFCERHKDGVRVEVSDRHGERASGREPLRIGDSHTIFRV